MLLDPRVMPDWQIAREAEKNMKKVGRLAEEFGILPDELLPYGHYMGKIEQAAVLERTKEKPNGKYVDITAMTPTPLGEGKSTTTIGLLQGLGKRKIRASAAIRQPSAGPTMGMKGSAAGGGCAQCIPLVPYSLNFTGDIHAIGSAHNLAMTALTARMQHERNYDDQKLLSLSGMKRLNIDPTQINMGWALDFCTQALRNAIIGIENDGHKNDGFMMRSHWIITVASEVMSILSLCSSLADLRKRIGKITVALDKSGNPVTTEDLKVAGAMTAWLTEAIKPNIIQTIEGQPVLAHTGPFGNIALGQSSVIADRIGLKLSDIHITESGFAADMGFEKFWNLKCHYSGLAPDCAVVVATIRALKNQGGAPDPRPGQPLPEEYTTSRPEYVEKGLENLLHHLSLVKKAGISSVVCINKFYTDSDEEIRIVRNICEKAGARVAVSEHWLKGGEGALELADCVSDAIADAKNSFTPLYDWNLPILEKIQTVAKEVYGANDVIIEPLALNKIAMYQKRPDGAELGVCMVKTQYSVSDNPKAKGAPKNWFLRVRDALLYSGAGLVCPVAGDINLMPGTGSNPAFRNIDVDTNTGQVIGLF